MGHAAMNLPSTMRYAAAREPGPPEVLAVATTDTPRPRAGEVLIRVAYAGVNRPDCLQRAGAYPPPPDASPIIGLEVAGEIAAVGDGVDRWHVGNRVCALTPGGGYAELLHHTRGILPAASGWLVAAGSREPARELLHGLEQRVRPRTSHGGRDLPRARRLQAASASPRSSSPRHSAQRSSRPSAARTRRLSAATSAPITSSIIASRTSWKRCA